MKYAFFTGAAGGISSALVEGLDKKGEWTIFAAYHRKPLVDLLKKVSDRVIPIHIDIGSQESCDAAAAEVAKYTDHLDLLANVAGVHTMDSLVEGDPVKTLEWIINANTLGMARVTKSFFPMINACKGRIINFSSECGWMQPQPFNSPYAISKYAVEAYTIGLRRELAFLGIKVIKIQPGSFKSGMHGDASAGYQKLLDKTQMYVPVLSVMKPMMTMAMKHPHEMDALVKVFLEAVYAKHPKQNYKVKNTWYLALIDPIPGWIMDPAYNMVIGFGYKVLHALGKA